MDSHLQYPNCLIKREIFSKSEKSVESRGFAESGFCRVLVEVGDFFSDLQIQTLQVARIFNFFFLHIVCTRAQASGLLHRVRVRVLRLRLRLGLGLG